MYTLKSQYIQTYLQIQIPSNTNTVPHNDTIATVSPYVYRTLDHSSQQIRLIRISPLASAAPAYDGDCGITWDPPECKIDTFNLHSAPPYLALSYTWGEANIVKSHVQLDGGSFEVTNTLYQFLCCFRSDSQNKDGSTYLWIDQICIDQSNLVERSYTVNFMSHIYRRCTFAISWLEYDTETYHTARKFLESKYSFADALIVLLKNRYFTRLWIVQEVLLAPEVLVYCGNILIPFADMQKCASDKQQIVHPQISNSSLYLLWDCVHNRDGRSLASCIDRYSLNECQDPRDKVYALLGLVTEKESARLDVNYDKPVIEVYVDAVKVIVNDFWGKRNRNVSTDWRSNVETMLCLRQRMLLPHWLLMSEDEILWKLFIGVKHDEHDYARLLALLRVYGGDAEGLV